MGRCSYRAAPAQVDKPNGRLDGRNDVLPHPESQEAERHGDRIGRCSIRAAPGNGEEALLRWSPCGFARSRRAELPTLSPTAPLVCCGPAPWTKRGQLRRALFPCRTRVALRCLVGSLVRFFVYFALRDRRRLVNPGASAGSTLEHRPNQPGSPHDPNERSAGSGSSSRSAGL